jgi:hypothetical protein
VRTFSKLLFGVLLTLSTATTCTHQVSRHEYMTKIEQICDEAIPTLEKDLKLSGRKYRSEQIKVLDDRAALTRDIQAQVRALERPPGDYESVDSWVSELDSVRLGYSTLRRSLETDDFIVLALRLAATRPMVDRITGMASQAGLRRCETQGWRFDFD